MRVGGCLAVVAQWQSTGGSSQRCPGRLLAILLSSIFTSIPLLTCTLSVESDAIFLECDVTAYYNIQ